MALKIQVEARSILGRRGKVYDARGTVDGIEYDVRGASTRAEAKAQALAEIEYKRGAGEKVAHGFRLTAHGTREWFLQFPHGGGYGFDSESLHTALARIASEYHDHAAVQAFINA